MDFTTHSFATLFAIGTHLLTALMPTNSRVNYQFTSEICINSYFKIVFLIVMLIGSTLVLASCYLCIHALYNYAKLL